MASIDPFWRLLVRRVLAGLLGTSTAGLVLMIDIGVIDLPSQLSGFVVALLAIGFGAGLWLLLHDLFWTVRQCAAIVVPTWLVVCALSAWGIARHAEKEAQAAVAAARTEKMADDLRELARKSSQEAPVVPSDVHPSAEAKPESGIAPPPPPPVRHRKRLPETPAVDRVLPEPSPERNESDSDRDPNAFYQFGVLVAAVNGANVDMANGKIVFFKIAPIWNSTLNPDRSVEYQDLVLNCHGDNGQKLPSARLPPGVVAGTVIVPSAFGFTCDIVGRRK